MKYLRRFLDFLNGVQEGDQYYFDFSENGSGLIRFVKVHPRGKPDQVLLERGYYTPPEERTRVLADPKYQAQVRERKKRLEQEMQKLQEFAGKVHSIGGTELSAPRTA